MMRNTPPTPFRFKSERHRRAWWALNDMSSRPDPDPEAIGWWLWGGSLILYFIGWLWKQSLRLIGWFSTLRFARTETDPDIYELKQRRREEKRLARIHKLWTPQLNDMVQERYGENRIGMITKVWESYGTIWHELDIEEQKSYTKRKMIYLPKSKPKCKNTDEQMDTLSELFEGYEDVDIGVDYAHGDDGSVVSTFGDDSV